jgi:hypothetical protein
MSRSRSQSRSWSQSRTRKQQELALALTQASDADREEKRKIALQAHNAKAQIAAAHVAQQKANADASAAAMRQREADAQLADALDAQARAKVAQELAEAEKAATAQHIVELPADWTSVSDSAGIDIGVDAPEKCAFFARKMKQSAKKTPTSTASQCMDGLRVHRVVRVENAPLFGRYHRERDEIRGRLAATRAAGHEVVKLEAHAPA